MARTDTAVVQFYDLIEAAARQRILLGKVPARRPLIDELIGLLDAVERFEGGWEASPVCEIQEVRDVLEEERSATGVLVGWKAIGLLREIAAAFVADSEEVYGGVDEAAEVARVFLR